MTASPEQEARIRAIGNAACEIIEALRLIGKANGLSTEDTLTALRLAGEALGNAADVIAQIKELTGHGSDHPL